MRILNRDEHLNNFWRRVNVLSVVRYNIVRTKICGPKDSATKMGKSYSRAVEHKGDPQVKVINTLEKHTTAHGGHDIKLLVILD